jgi:hypothetical protein
MIYCPYRELHAKASTDYEVKVSALYQMLLALQYSAPSEDIILDIHELVYSEDEGSDINSM